VYDNEVARIIGPSGPAELIPGESADVESFRKEYLGRALVNPRSKIIARIYSPSKEGLDKGFFKRRFREALGRRFSPAGPVPAASMPAANLPPANTLPPGGVLPWPGVLDFRRDSARLVFGEADFLPGLIIDRFVGWPWEDLEGAVPERPPGFGPALAALGPPASWLSIQFLAYGMDSRRDLILEALEEVLAAPLRLPGKAAVAGSPREPPGGDPGAPPDGPPAEPPPLLGLPAGIVEKSAAKVRELEGLPLREGLLRGTCPPGGIVVFEGGLPQLVRLEEGQKTGCFLDQRENRLLAGAYIKAWCPGGRILDAFSYTGGFALQAAGAGAAQVIAVDSSAAALAGAVENARLNGLGDRLQTLEADAFEFLRNYKRTGERFDAVILDPPAFAKTRPALEGALRGYKEINLRAMGLLKPGGILISCSCSQALDEGRFKRMIAEAAVDADRRLIQLDFRGQGADHPVLVGYDESCYLKCGYYRVL
jgi:23S rRNA (cytosine1962-C5)-methyltransferase